jgi:hypothetical protein
MADLGTQQRPNAIEQIENDLLREVELARAEFKYHLNGNHEAHEAAKSRYFETLMVFNSFVLDRKLPAKSVAAAG